LIQHIGAIHIKSDGNNKASLSKSFIHKSNDYANSCIGKPIFEIFNVCHKSLSKSEYHLLEMCLKTYDVGPWPSLLLESDVSLTLFKRPTFVERIAMIYLMHTNI
jgi:hypothetical protein